MSSTTTIRLFPTHSWVLVSAWGLLNPARVLGRAHTVIILKRVCVCVCLCVLLWFLIETHTMNTLMSWGLCKRVHSLSTKLRFPVSISLHLRFILNYSLGSFRFFGKECQGNSKLLYGVGNPWRRRRCRHQRHRLPPNRMTSRHFNDRKRKLIYPKVFHLHSCCCCWDDVTEKESQLQGGEE